MIYVSVNFFVFWGERVLMCLTNIMTIVSVECVQLTVLLENILGEKSWAEEECDSIDEPQCPAG